MADIKKLESELWEAADELRANSKLTSQQYCMTVLGLIFLRYAQGRCKRADAQIEKERAESAKKTTRRLPPKAQKTIRPKGPCLYPKKHAMTRC